MLFYGKIFIDLKVIGCLRFDFFGYLSINKGYCVPFVIELDGPFHFQNIHNKLDITQKYDCLKDYYCVVNRICLLRIDIYDCINKFKDIIELFFHDMIEKKRLIRRCVGESYGNQ